MDNEFFLNSGLQQPPVHFEPPSTSPATIFNWPSMSSSSSMEIQPPLLNLGRNPTNDCFFWEKSTEQSIFDSALSSLVSSPTASNSNFSGGGGGDSFIIRELIGKLGNIGNRSGEIYGTPASNNGKGYATPISSPPPPPPKLNIPMMAAAAKPTPLADFSGDPGFAERAARLSCFGSRSFNGRNISAAFAVNNGNIVNGPAATSVGINGKLTRVSSTPSLKALAPQMCNNDHNPKKHSNVNDESTVSRQQIRGAGDSCPKNSGELSRKRKSAPKGKSKENSPSTASPSSSSSKGSEGNEESDPKRSKMSEENGKKEEGSAKTTSEEGGGGKGNKTKPAEPPKDYIHVRARRGQATDSHSLAERVRREKISERMKLLQDLVPGCNKVTGKALMLDEIINYVQSLQRQVEFLSMKLASVNTRLDFNVDALLSKDIIQQSNHPIHQQPYLAHNQPQQHNNVTLHPNGTIPQSPLDPMDTSTLSRSFNTHLPTLTQFTVPIPQYPTFCEDDLHSIVQMGSTQNLVRESELFQSQPQVFQGSNQASHMKIEI